MNWNIDEIITKNVKETFQLNFSKPKSLSDSYMIYTTHSVTHPELSNFVFRSSAGGTAFGPRRPTAVPVVTPGAATASRRWRLTPAPACVMRWWCCGGWQCSTPPWAPAGETAHTRLHTARGLLKVQMKWKITFQPFKILLCTCWPKKAFILFFIQNGSKSNQDFFL